MMHVFSVNGLTQHALVRGRADASVLLLVQAGPGFPMIHEADALERALELERDFRVVYWDQRGTGRSFDPAQTGPLTLDTLVDDVASMAVALCARLEVPSVDVAGFSMGGSLAMLAASRAGGRIRRVLAVGPDIEVAASEEFAWQFARDEAVRRGHRRALRELEAIGAPPHDTAERFMTRVKWVTNFGGIAVGASFLGLFLHHVFRLLRSPAYSLRQVVAALRGIQITQGRLLGDLGHFSLTARLSQLDVPLTVVQGRLDAAAPPALAQTFFDGLVATQGKRLVWFNDCAHSPHFEAPGAFRQVVLDAFTG